MADCPAAGDQQGPGRQVNPAPGGSAGTQGRRTCPVGECPPAPLTRGQDFLARPRAKPRDNDTAPRGPLMDLSIDVHPGLSREAAEFGQAEAVVVAGDQAGCGQLLETGPEPVLVPL